MSASAWGKALFESNEGQSNQEAEVAWRLLGRSLGMWLLQPVEPVFNVAVIKQRPVALVQCEKDKSEI
jgi:hypothetical protein